MKWETPALASVSSREPAPIQKPSATERTLGIRSEMTRSPESSSERTYFCTAALSLPGPFARLPVSAARRSALYPTQNGFPSGSRMIVKVTFVPTFVSTTEAPAAVRRSISASRSSVAKSRWIGYDAGRDFSRR
jgi:hypothetical protein